MGATSFLKSCIRLLQLAKKPGKSELWLSIKICFLGITLIGMIGFIIKIVSSLLTMGIFGG